MQPSAGWIVVTTAADFEPQIRLAMRKWRRHPAIEDFAQEARLALHKARLRGIDLTPGYAYTVARGVMTSAYKAWRRRHADGLLSDPPAKPYTAVADRAEELLALEPLDVVISAHCQKALDLAAGNATVAADVLGIGRATIYRWLKSRFVVQREGAAPAAPRLSRASTGS